MDTLVNKADKTIDDFEKQEEKDKETAPYTKILLTYADRTDRVLLFLGYFFSFASGIGMPSFSYLLGDVMVNFTDPNIDLLEGIKPVIYRFVGVGCGMFLSAYFYYIFLAIMAERIGKKTRVAYFKAILSQEIAWFDSEVNITELSARLSKESQAIQESLGDKMGKFLLTMTMAVAGFFFSFLRGWYLSVLLILVFPVIFLMMGSLFKLMENSFKANLKAYGQSAGYSE